MAFGGGGGGLGGGGGDGRGGDGRGGSIASVIGGTKSRWPWS